MWETTNQDPITKQIALESGGGLDKSSENHRETLHATHSSGTPEANVELGAPRQLGEGHVKRKSESVDIAENN